MDPRIQSRFSETLDSISKAEGLRTVPNMDYGSQLYLEYKGRKLLNLASNNYLGLAGSESLKNEAVRAVKLYGTSSSASRLISGNYKIYDRLENLLCKFKNLPKALAVGSGYAANLCILGSLAGRETVIFADRLNHASIIDGALMSRAKLVRYRHSDMDHLGFLLEKHRGLPSKILITDTVFSMDGDTAPLEEILLLCKKYHVLMVVDEAHATGVFGRGLACHAGLETEIDVHMGTFSKALGSYGGYIASSREIIDLIITRGRPFIYSTSLPPAVVGANLAALEAVMNNPHKSDYLLEISGILRSHLQELGFDTGRSTTQIIPVILGKNSLAIKARQLLIDSGIFTGVIRPPTVPENTARLRVSLRVDVGEEEIRLIKESFALLAEELGVSG